MPTEDIDPQLLEILRCPVSHSALKFADETLIKHLNAKIEAGTLVNRAGQAIEETIETGLVNNDQTLLMVIRNGIAIMVADQAIELEKQT